MVDDTNLEIMDKGSTSRIVRAKTEDWLAQTEDNIITRAIDLYKTGQLSPQEAICRIAEISSLRLFSEYLETNIQKGVAAAEKELGQNG